MNLWKNVAEQQAKYYNKRHENKTYQLGDKVLLRNLNVRTLRPKKKIDHRQLGSFEIIKKIETQAYRLNFPEKYDAIHSVFYVSLLKPWYSRNGENPKPQTILVKNKMKWKVSKVFDKRVKKGEIEYLIEWIDSPPYENSWKSMKHLSNAQKAIDNFEHARKQRKPTAKSKRTNARAKKNKFKEVAAVPSESQAAPKKQGKPRKNNWLRDRA